MDWIWRSGRTVSGGIATIDKVTGSMIKRSEVSGGLAVRGRGRARCAWLLGIVLGLSPIVAMAGSWWNPDWKFRKEITLDLTATGGNVATSVQDVPVLVRLSIANFSYFNDAKPDGSDFRVLAGDDKTPLKFHFERYDSQSQMAFLWVRVPQAAGAAKTDKFFVYYGNSSAPAGADAPGSYDANQALVLHFGEASGAPQDATAYKNNAASSTAEASAGSLIAGGLKFNGSQSVTVPASASLRLVPAQGYTASAWVKPDALQGTQTVIALNDQGREVVLGIEGARAVARFTGGGTPVVVQSTSELTPAAWHHLAVSAAGGQLTLFVDGEPAGSAAATLVELGGKLTIGGGAAGGAFFTGEIDEVEVSKVGRSADWIKFAAKSEGMDATLVVYGADSQPEGGQTSYFGTIIKNLTVDSWVVIVICLVMLLVAIVVMIGKAILLSRIEGANRRFMKEFRKMSGDPRALDKPVSAEDEAKAEQTSLVSALSSEKGDLAVSTLFQLYHHGVAELDKRVPSGTPPPPKSRRPAAAAPELRQGTFDSGAVALLEDFENDLHAGRILSSQSIAAIHAAMDSTGARVQQRLSAQMVLLTIAISGGPFLGLLGTVIGVMITFAAIAASGDVNVNAIAPGVSAALMATVAGLAVAIPCLFGYNWLNTRIKAITVDNRVFVDEFIARLAEHFS